MPKNIADTTLNDVKDAAEDTLDNARESVEETVDAAEARLNRLSTVKKAVLVGSAVVVGYSLLSAVFRRVITPKEEVVEGDIIVVTSDQIIDES